MKKTQQKTKRVESNKQQQRSAPASFDARKLFSLDPCEDGLYDAIQFLKEHRCITAPRRFWDQVRKLKERSDGYYRNETDPMEEMRKMARDVRIIVRPKIFARQILENDSFEEYASMLIEGKKFNAFKRKVYNTLKDKLAELSQDKTKLNIESTASRIETLQADLENSKTELEQLKKQLESEKSIPMPLEKFDPIDAMYGSHDEYAYESLDENDRFLIAEELAQALAS